MSAPVVDFEEGMGLPVPGIIHGMPDIVYHSLPDSLSSSGARTLAKPGGPALYRYRQLCPDTDTTAFRFGRAAHIAVVSGSLDDLTVCPYATMQSKAAKEWRASAPHDWVTETEFEQLRGMREAAYKHEYARELLTAPGVCEASILAPWDGTRYLKARPDKWLTTPGPDGLVTIIDYKTTVDATPYKFTRHILDYGYHQAAAWYAAVMRGAGIVDDTMQARMVFIAQEKTAPWRVAVYQLDPGFVDIGERLNVRALEAWDTGYLTGAWPGLADNQTTPVTLTAPKWAADQT